MKKWMLIIGIIIFLSGCSVNKHSKPCKQCPQYTHGHYEKNEII